MSFTGVIDRVANIEYRLFRMNSALTSTSASSGPRRKRTGNLRPRPGRPGTSASVWAPPARTVASGYADSTIGIDCSPRPVAKASTRFLRLSAGKVADSRIAEPPRAAWKVSSVSISRRI